MNKSRLAKGIRQRSPTLRLGHPLQLGIRFLGNELALKRRYLETTLSGSVHTGFGAVVFPSIRLEDASKKSQC